MKVFPGTHLLLSFFFFQTLSLVVEFNFKTDLTAYQFGQKLHQAMPDKSHPLTLFLPESDISTLLFTQDI